MTEEEQKAYEQEVKIILDVAEETRASARARGVKPATDAYEDLFQRNLAERRKAKGQ